jgi:hypothetical protein
VLAHVLQEELQRVGQDLRGVGGPDGLFGRSGDRVGLVGVVGSVDRDRAVGQRGADIVDGGLVEVELERKRLELRCLDAAALLRLREECINGRDFDRGVQRKFLSVSSVLRARASDRVAITRRCSFDIAPSRPALPNTYVLGVRSAGSSQTRFPRERCRHSVQRLTCCEIPG